MNNLPIVKYDEKDNMNDVIFVISIIALALPLFYLTFVSNCDSMTINKPIKQYEFWNL